MNKASREVVDEFAQAAQYWGWQQDCGTGSSVDSALEQYEDARAALVKRIERLERQNRDLRRRGREQRDAVLEARAQLRAEGW